MFLTTILFIEVICYSVLPFILYKIYRDSNVADKLEIREDSDFVLCALFCFIPIVNIGAFVAICFIILDGKVIFKNASWNK